MESLWRGGRVRVVGRAGMLEKKVEVCGRDRMFATLKLDCRLREEV